MYADVRAWAEFGQGNNSEWASFELLSRKPQMAEWRCMERILGESKDELFDDQFLYLGTGETRGLLMVAPDLQEHINQELRREATILKVKRKVREERLLARGGGSTKDDEDGSGGHNSGKTQDKSNTQRHVPTIGER